MQLNFQATTVKQFMVMKYEIKELSELAVGEKLVLKKCSVLFRKERVDASILSRFRTLIKYFKRK